MNEREQHKARNWVEENYPKAMGGLKAALIMAYGAGLDAGMAEAQQLLAETVAEMTRGRADSGHPDYRKEWAP